MMLQYWFTGPIRGFRGGGEQINMCGYIYIHIQMHIYIYKHRSMCLCVKNLLGVPNGFKRFGVRSLAPQAPDVAQLD